MKIGRSKQGIRWHSSYDPQYVRSLVEKKVKVALGTAVVDWIDVVPTARTTGDKMDTKTLLP